MPQEVFPLRIQTRLVDKFGRCIKMLMKCPVPHNFVITDFDGLTIKYERRFALIICGENEPYIKEVYFYEDDRSRVG